MKRSRRELSIWLSIDLSLKITILRSFPVLLSFTQNMELLYLKEDILMIIYCDVLGKVVCTARISRVPSFSLSFQQKRKNINTDFFMVWWGKQSLVKLAKRDLLLPRNRLRRRIPAIKKTCTLMVAHASVWKVPLGQKPEVGFCTHKIFFRSYKVEALKKTKPLSGTHYRKRLFSPNKKACLTRNKGSKPKSNRTRSW